MARWYYLGPWIPPNPADRLPAYKAPSWAVGSIDLRPSTPSTTHGFFVSDHAILDSDYEAFGDASGTRLEGLTMSGAQRARWASMLGIAETPVAGSLLDLLWNTLTVYSDPDGVTRARPLMPTAGGVLELHLGGHSLVRSARIPRDVTRTPHWDKMQRVLQASYRDVEMVARDGGTPKARTTHARWLGAMRDKYGLTDDQATGLIVPADLPRVRPVKPETTITESFNTADSATLGPDLTWSALHNDIGVVGNRARGQAAGVVSVEQAASDLSSSDHYAQAEIHDTATVIDVGVLSRLVSGPTCYLAYFADSSGEARLYSIVANSYTQIGSGWGVAPTNGDVLKCHANGSSISLVYNGVDRVGPNTDTAVASGVRCGLWAYDVGGDLDNFEAADLAAGGTTRGAPFGSRGTAFNGGRTFMGLIR